MPYRVGLYTLGCKVSQYETEAIAEAFEEQGFVRVKFSDIADVYVINTCTVTAESDHKSRKAVRRAIKKNPQALVMATGCYTQNNAEEMLLIPGVAYVSGTQDKLNLVSVACTILEQKKRGEKVCPSLRLAPLNTPFETMAIRQAPRTRAVIKIEDGCDGCCTYCSIVKARGPVRSKPREAILAEINHLAKNGTREVVLTGIETASWGQDLGKERLIDLLEMLEIESEIVRIRLGSIAPEKLRSGFAERFAKLKKATPHLHLSVQSGSSAVLARMKRRYTREQLLETIALLRKHIPDIELTTDIIVGFPGETEEDFEDTISLAEEADFLHIHVFPYSKRKGTVAESLPDQIPETTKKERSRRLTTLSKNITERRLSRLICRQVPLSILWETEKDGFWQGHSDAFVEVRAKSFYNLHGQITNLLPTHQENGMLFGDILPEI